MLVKSRVCCKIEINTVILQLLGMDYKQTESNNTKKGTGERKNIRKPKKGTGERKNRRKPKKASRRVTVNDAVCPHRREDQVYVPPMRRDSYDNRKHPIVLTINTSSSSQGVMTSHMCSPRRPNRGKHISPVSGGTFAKGPNGIDKGFKMRRSLPVNGVQPCIDLSSDVLSISHISHLNMDEKKNKLSDGMIPSFIQETLDKLLTTFEMTRCFIDGQYKSPEGWKDMNVDPKGVMQFTITDREQYDIGIPLLLSTLEHIHQTCMSIRMRTQRRFPDDKPDSITSRCLCVDLFEVSWAIQTHLFEMHKIGVRCIMMGVNNTLYVDKHILLSMVRDSLTRTYMSKENAYWAFNTIATIIATEW